jgi:hypothetical protein
LESFNARLRDKLLTGEKGTKKRFASL